MVISGRNPFPLSVAGFMAASGTSANATSPCIVFTHDVSAELVASP